VFAALPAALGCGAASRFHLKRAVTGLGAHADRDCHFHLHAMNRGGPARVTVAPVPVIRPPPLLPDWHWGWWEW